jgi:hypothetical protein
MSHPVPFCPIDVCLPLEGVPASPSPGLRTASGAKRHLGARLPSSVFAMTEESTNSQKMLVAVVIAEGTALAERASRNGVPVRTAYHGRIVVLTPSRPDRTVEFSSLRSSIG